MVVIITAIVANADKKLLFGLLDHIKKRFPSAIIVLGGYTVEDNGLPTVLLVEMGVIDGI